MHFYRYALYSAIGSVLIFLLIILSPENYFILEWKQSYLHTGILFPVLLLCWLFSMIAIAFNFIYLDQMHMNVFVPVKRRKKFLPTMLTIPSFISFLWFCFQLYKGK